MPDNRFILLKKFYTPMDVLTNLADGEYREFQLELEALKELLECACEKNFTLEYGYKIGGNDYVRKQTQRFINRLYITTLEVIRSMGLDFPNRIDSDTNPDLMLENINAAIDVLGIGYHLKKITHSYYGFAIVVREKD